MKKKFLSVLLTVSLIFAIVPFSTSAQTKQFTDVKSSDWYSNAVDYVTGRGLFAGTSDTTFSPNMKMSRGMLVTVLGRRSKVKAEDYKSQYPTFDDVKSTDYFQPYTEWAVEYEVAFGVGNNRFNPDAPVTREEFVTMLYRYAKISGNVYSFFPDNKYPELDHLPVFSDISTVSSWAKTPMTWARYWSIISGTTTTNPTTCAPKLTTSRGQAAQMLWNGSSNGSLANSVLVSDSFVEPDALSTIGSWDISTGIFAWGPPVDVDGHPYPDPYPEGKWYLPFYFEIINKSSDEKFFITDDDSEDDPIEINLLRGGNSYPMSKDTQFRGSAYNLGKIGAQDYPSSYASFTAVFEVPENEDMDIDENVLEVKKGSQVTHFRVRDLPGR